MSFLNVLNNLIKPVSDLVDSVHTSQEERLEAQAAILKLQSSVTEKVLSLEETVVKSQAQVITAEAKGQSWLQRNWRPITMMTFLVLITADIFGFTEYRLSEQAWELLKLGIGGYVIGRSAEKIVPGAVPAIQNAIKKINSPT